MCETAELWHSGFHISLKSSATEPRPGAGPASETTPLRDVSSHPLANAFMAQPENCQLKERNLLYAMCI